MLQHARSSGKFPETGSLGEYDWHQKVNRQQGEVDERLEYQQFYLGHRG